MSGQLESSNEVGECWSLFLLTFLLVDGFPTGGVYDRMEVGNEVGGRPDSWLARPALRGGCPLKVSKSTSVRWVSFESLKIVLDASWKIGSKGSWII